MKAFEVANLSHRYAEGQAALHEVTFTVAEGERVAIIGANGAGKSTLLWCMCGLIQPSSGEIRVLETPVTRHSQSHVRQSVGILFQDPDDQIFMPTVLEDVAFGLMNRGLTWNAAKDRAKLWLQRVGMLEAAERHPHHLSLGERKRVAIAGVLAVEPRILVLDEPTSGLDPRGRREFCQLLTTLSHTVILATHDMDLARTLCPRTLLLYRGRLVADGATSRLLSNEALLEAHGL